MPHPRLWCAALAALTLTPATASAATVDLTKPAYGTVEIWVENDEATQLLKRCGPDCTTAHEYGGEQDCPEPEPGGPRIRCWRFALEVRAIAGDGFEPLPWGPECPKLVGANCLIERQSTGTENHATLHAEFRDVGAPTRPDLSALGAGPFNRTVTVRATAQDNLGVAGIEFKAGSTSLGTDTSAPFELSFDSARFPDGALEVTARAFDAAGNAAESAIPLRLDNTPPAVTVTGPGPADASPSFAFTSGDAISTLCALDGAALTACTSPVAFTNLADGEHTLRIQVSDILGNVKSYPHPFRIDTTAPETEITDGTVDGTRTSEPTARFEFRSEPGATLSCRLDDGPPTVCASPLRLAGLAPGAHRFAVAATDAAGNSDATPATRTWTVAVDGDEDGFARDIDCDDANPAINPGALDVPRNSIDEDCKDGPARAAVLRATPRVSWTYHGKRLRIVAFVIVDAEPGTRLELRCSARPCPFTIKRALARRPGRMVMTTAFKRRWLRPGTRLTVTLNAPGAIGRRVELTVTADGHGLTRVERCLAPCG